MFKFLKQFFIYGFASVLGKIAAVFLLPLYTNVLSQNEFGALAMITAVKGVIDLFSNLNIHSGVARDYYEKSIDRTKIISTGFFSIIFFSVLFMLIMLYSRSYWINNVLNVGDYERAFVFMLFTMPAGSLLIYFTVLTRYKQKAVLYSVGNLIQLFIQISLTIYFILVIRTGIVGVFYGILAGEFVGIIYYYFLNRENIKFTFHKNLLIRVLKYSIPTLPAIAAIWADSNVGQLLIGKYISLADAGIYSIALRIASVYLLIRQAFGNVWLPFVYENMHKENFERDVMRIFNASTVALLIISLNLSVFSESIILLLSTPDYIDASKVLIILTIPMSLSILNQFAAIGPNISRKTIYISYANIAGTAVNLLGLFLFLPRFGVLIVPVFLLISRLIVFILTAYYTKKEIGLIYPWLNVLILVIAILGILVFMQLVENKIIRLALLTFSNVVGVYYIYKHYKIKTILTKRK